VPRAKRRQGGDGLEEFRVSSSGSVRVATEDVPEHDPAVDALITFGRLNERLVLGSVMAPGPDHPEVLGM